MPSQRNTDEEAQEKWTPPKHNVCFTYPQGQVSIIPQILTLMAVTCSLLAFDVFGYSENFMCFEYSLSDNEQEPICAGLEMTSESFYGFDVDGWAGALQAAAVFGALAAALGFVAFVLLITATCFEKTPRQLMIIWIIQAVCAVFSILTLVGGAADVCEQFDADSNCEKEGARADTGATFEIFALLLYLAAMTMTLLWWIRLRREKNGATSPEETRALVAGGDVPQAGGGVSVKTSILPNGDKRIEREFVNENGDLVKEVTIEQAGATESPEDEEDSHISL